MYLFRKKESNENMKRYLLWGLIALELFMSFSFTGYIHIAPISLTLVYIPVMLAGCLMGPAEASLVGAVFGSASMWKASAFYVSAGDTLFSPMMSGKPVQSILLSIGARTLFGLLIGLMYRAAKECRHPYAGIILVNSVGKTLHSALVYSFMEILFPETGYKVTNAFSGFLEKDSLILLLVQNGIVLLCYYLLNLDSVRRFGDRMQMVNQMETGVLHSRKTMGLAYAVAFGASFSVARYFINRIETVLVQHGIYLSEESVYDVTHLQIQFLLGISSLFALAILVVVLYLKNFNYLYYEAKLDGLTGLISRGQFFLLGEKMLEDWKPGRDGKEGYFIIYDIDNLKQINDRYGHPEGDKIIMDVSFRLRTALGDRGIVGRLGGDEFVALLFMEGGENRIQELLKGLQKEVETIRIGDDSVTISIGIVAVKEGETLSEMYHRADQLLYEAKKRGKNQFVYQG